NMVNLDQELLKIMKEILEEYEISSVFLVGDFFIGEWYKSTLAYLEKPYEVLSEIQTNRRVQYRKVFIGNNLVSKGNCYFAKNIVKGNRSGEQYIFLGNDRLKSDISIQAMENGIVSMKKLLEAGCFWYDASCDIDFIMNEEHDLHFMIDLYRVKEQRIVPMKLVGIPSRPPRATRIKVRLKMLSENVLEIQVDDLGFGNIYPSSNLSWNQELVLE
ncbi:MAG: DUF5716 family protein, partial [Eubacteriales bacterium]